MGLLISETDLKKVNEKKKVLIVTYYWPPSGGSGVQRWVKFAKYLPEFNIDPIILTVKDGTYPIIDETLSDEVSPDLEVLKTRSLEPYSLFAKLRGKTAKEVSTPSTAFSDDGSIFKKIGVWVRANFFIPDARVGWVPFAFRKADFIISRYDLDTIITTGPPNSSHLIGLKLKNKYQSLKWVMDMRDPWSQIFYNQHLPRTKWASNKDISLEKKCLSKADEVIVVSDSMERIQKKVLNRKYQVISNGFDHEDFSTVIHDDKNNRISIKYIGSMTETAIPHVFFKALNALDEEKKSKLSVTFIGSFNEKVQSIITEYKLEDIIEFKEYVPHMEAKKEMQTADLLLLVIPATIDNELIITGKIFDYIGAQTPILCIGPENGDASKLISENKYGLNATYDDINTIKTVLEDLISGGGISFTEWKGDLKEHPFSRLSLTKQLAEELHEVTDN